MLVLWFNPKSEQFYLKSCFNTCVLKIYDENSYSHFIVDIYKYSEKNKTYISDSYKMSLRIKEFDLKRKKIIKKRAIRNKIMLFIDRLLKIN